MAGEPLCSLNHDWADHYEPHYLELYRGYIFFSRHVHSLIAVWGTTCLRMEGGSTLIRLLFGDPFLLCTLCTLTHGPYLPAWLPLWRGGGRSSSSGALYQFTFTKRSSQFQQPGQLKQNQLRDHMYLTFLCVSTGLGCQVQWMPTTQA